MLASNGLTGLVHEKTDIFDDGKKWVACKSWRAERKPLNMYGIVLGDCARGWHNACGDVCIRIAWTLQVVHTRGAIWIKYACLKNCTADS